MECRWPERENGQLFIRSESLENRDFPLLRLFRFAITMSRKSLVVVIVGSLNRILSHNSNIPKVLTFLYNLGARLYHGIHGNPLYNYSVIIEDLSGNNRILFSSKTDYNIATNDIDMEIKNRHIKDSGSVLIMLSIDHLRGFSDKVLNPLLNMQETMSISVDSIDGHDCVAFGGAFDHLHVGHKLLLSQAALMTKDKMVCGISDKELIENKKYRKYMESFDLRSKNVKSFICSFKNTVDLTIVPIYDPYGPSIVDHNIDAIVVSTETVAGAEKINAIRKENRLSTLEVAVVDLISAFKTNNSTLSEEIKLKVSSTDIRKHIFTEDKKQN